MWATPSPEKSPYSALKGPLRMSTSCTSLGSQRLQRAQVPLAVSLRRLVLLHIIHQHLEAAVDASVVQIETKAADFERLPSTFVLARVDAGGQRVEYLVVTGEQRLLVDGIVAAVDGIEGRGGDYDAVVHQGDGVMDMQFNLLSWVSSFEHTFLVSDVLATYLERDSSCWGLQREVPLRVGLRFDTSGAGAGVTVAPATAWSFSSSTTPEIDCGSACAHRHCPTNQSTSTARFEKANSWR